MKSIIDCSKRCKANCFLGTEQPYIFRKEEYTSPPPGYKPIYINHLGRHGARYLANARGINLVYRIIRDARYKNCLKTEGFQLERDIERFMAVQAGNYGLLSKSGAQMERGIARRMYENYPEVFGKQVIAVSTYVERTKESMAAFLAELSRYTAREKFNISSNGRVDPILRFFDLNTEYLNYKKQGDWRLQVAAYENRKDYATCILAQFFEKPYLDSLDHQNAIVTDIYSFYTNQFDVGENVGLRKYFTCKELKYYWQNKNLTAYLEKGPSNIGQDLPTNIAFALLADFLFTTDNGIRTNQVSANLRFAHAETIIPFASILKLNCCSVQTNNLSKVDCIWQDYNVAPMAANIQWIVYRRENSYLIKMLYNEKEIDFPIDSAIKPYYKWEDIKEFYFSELRNLNLNVNESIVELVKNYQVY